jgi:hypothetical protein
MEKWEMDLREEIRDAMSNPSTPPNKKVTKVQFRPLLFFAALLLFIMNFVVIERKHPGFFAEKIDHCVSYFHRDTNVHQNQPDPFIMALQGLDSRLEALEAKEDYTDEELKAELKELRDKVYLMVVVQDENAAISKKILSQYNYEGQQFIHIDPDWKIDRMPTHINLTPESEEFLRKRLR